NGSRDRCCAGRRSGPGASARGVAFPLGGRNSRRDPALVQRPGTARARRARRGAGGGPAESGGMRLAGALFLATLFCVTWEKVQWNAAGAVGIADILTVLFLLAFAFEWGRPRFPRTTVIVLLIFAALLVVYLIG